MCRKKAFAVISNPISSPSCHQAARSTVLTVLRPSAPETVPQEAREIVRRRAGDPPPLASVQVQPIGQVPGPAAPARGSAGDGSRSGSDSGGGGPIVVRPCPAASSAAPSTSTSSGKWALTARSSSGRRESSARREADHLAARVDTGIGPPAASRAPAPREIGRAPLLAPPESSVGPAGGRSRDTAFPRRRGPAGWSGWSRRMRSMVPARAPAPPEPSPRRRPCGASA